jgi:hypothetical protein
MSSPESVNAATGGAGQTDTGDLSAGTPSIWTQISNTIGSLVNLSPDSLAKAWGLWTAAKAAVNTVASGVASAAVGSTIYQAQAKYMPNPLTPAVLADMVVRNILPDSTGTTGTPPADFPAPRMPGGVAGHSATDEAALSGISGNRFAALAYATGESYGIVDALRMWDRGNYLKAANPGPNYTSGTPLYIAGGSQADLYGITEAELDTVIAYSRVRDEFIPDLKKSAKNTISPADAVEIAVKQIMSVADATDLYAAGGGMPEQFQMLVDSAGDSAGVEKATELYGHGVITYGQLQQIVAMSRMNHRFYYLAGIGPDGPTTTEPYQAPFNLKWLPPYEIKEAATAGVVTQQQALQWMLEQGYPEDQANAFAGTLATGTVTTVKHETEAMVLSELTAGMISQGEATTALGNLGYAADAIPFILQYTQARAVISARNTAVSRVRSGFLVGAVSADQATASLSQVGVPQPTITALIADWTAEKAVPHTGLTVAQIGKLLGESYITADEASQLWQLKGYSLTDVGYLFALYPPPTPPSSAGTAPEAGA